MKKLKDRKVLKMSLLLGLLGLGLQLIALEASADEIVKVPAPKVTDQMEAQALETGLGQIVPMAHVVSESTYGVQGAKRVLNQGRIELKDGSVLYPEEIRFVHIRKAERAPRDFDRSLERAPREWD